jgi:hypothetical protein
VLGYRSCNSLDQVTVRVYQRDALTGANVLADEGFEESGFSAARLADDVQMEKPVSLFDAERVFPISEIRSPEVRNPVPIVIMHRSTMPMQKSRRRPRESVTLSRDIKAARSAPVRLRTDRESGYVA